MSTSTTEAANLEKKIFKDVKYFLVGENEKLKLVLKESGAQREYYVTQLVNYIISDTCDIPELEQANELNIPIVKSEWVHMSIKCDTVLPHQPYSHVKNGLFTNLVFCPSQIPSTDRASLLAMIVYHHGKYKINLTSGCTHLVSAKAVGRKYDFVRKSQLNIKIVTPEWVTNSILSNQLLPEEEYEPVAMTSPLRSPLKTFYTQTVNSTINTPKYTQGNTASSFMTPVTPSQGSEKLAVISKDDKENTIEVNKAHEIVPNLFRGFIFYFCDYEERMTAETFNIWKDVICKAAGIIRNTYTDDVTHVICLHQQNPIFKKAIADGKLVGTAYWLNEILVAKKIFPPITPLHLPVPFTETLPGMKNSLITISGYEAKERSIVKHMINFLGGNYTGHMTRTHTHLICKKATGEKYTKAIEWGIPVVSAKWLGDMIQTGQDFPAKGKSKYALISIPDELSINPTFSTHITDIWKEYSLEEPEFDKDGQPKAKQRKFNSSIPPIKRVLFTGLTGPTVHRLRQNVQKMKGELAKTVNDCTHLVAPKITRTVKFLSAVSICKFLVAPAWVDDSFDAKKFLDETNYTLVDPESEELFGFKLKRSLQRAQTRQVCKGLHFHVTPSILPAPNAMKEIIECAGGKMTEVKSVEEVIDHFVHNTINDASYNSYLVSCLDDKKLWQDLVKEGYDIYNVELILSGVMKQELEWNLHHL